VAIAGTDRRLVTVDASPVAVGFARANAEAAGLTTRVDVRQGQLGEALRPAEKFAVIIADPPWVPRADVDHHPNDPELAIDGGDDGLEVTRRCLDVIDRHLSDDGAAVLQVGTSTQAARVRSWLASGRQLHIVETREFPGQGVLIYISRAQHAETALADSAAWSTSP
jgi:release factor glutamine methyltransferase